MARRCVPWLALVVLSATLINCTGGSGDDVGVERDSEATSAPSWLAVDAPVLPDTDIEDRQPYWDQFAWNTFVALNFPAITPGDANGHLRGFPDLATYGSITAASNADLTVWETFKEKREIFNFPPEGPTQLTPVPTALPPWNNEVSYGPLRGGDGSAVLLPSGAATPDRLMHQNSGKEGFDGLDETAEVLSESLEVAYPDGTANPLLNHPVSPRVYQRVEIDGENVYFPVFYEVKVNWDFYNYVNQQQLFMPNVDPTSPGPFAASQNEIFLPYRTSASSLPGPSGGGRTSVAGYSAAHAMATATAVAGDPDGAAVEHPTPAGSIHLKAAWILLEDAQGNQLADPSRYHTADASYFLTLDGEPQLQNGLFGLIGLHIIQRVHVPAAAESGDKRRAAGGAFIFSTFEHEDVDTLEFVYTNYYDESIDSLPPLQPNGKPYPSGFYPPDLNNAYPVEPLTPYNPILDNTAEVNAQAHTQLGDSFWANYRLRGTQFRGIDVTATVEPVGAGTPTPYPTSVADPTGIGQPLYLANLMLETNHGLQFFQGQPGDTIPNNHFAGKGVDTNGAPGFDRDNRNMLQAGQAMNMGGCMGCHGVAQSKGYAFSFVLLSGFAGTATDTQTVFDPQAAPNVPVGPTPTPTPTPG